MKINYFCLFVVYLTIIVFNFILSYAHAELKTAGNTSRCITEQSMFDCMLDSGGRVNVELFANNIVHVRVSTDNIFHDRPTGALIADAKHENNGQTYDYTGSIFIRSSDLIVALIKSPLRLIIWRNDGTLVSLLQDNGFVWDKISGTVIAQFVSFANEHYLGLGERGGPIDRRGRTITMRNTDWAGATSLSDPLYISIPFYYTFKDGSAAGIFIDSGATPFFQFDTGGTGNLLFGVVSGDLDYYVMTGPTPVKVAQGYRQLTGANQMPPIWTLGYHQSRYSYNTQNEIISIANKLRELKIPTDVLYFDIDYLDKLHMFSWNKAAFPDPIAMNNYLHTSGFRSINIMEPVNNSGDPLFSYLSQSGFQLKDADGKSLVNQIWFGSVGWLDFTKQIVINWYKEQLKSFMGTYSIDGVWNDLNEPAQNFMSEAIYDFDGQPRTDAEARNLYALFEAKASYEAQLELRQNLRPWIFSRSGFAGVHRYGANWGGDADSSFSSLKTNVETSLSMGLSGQPFFGHDIGGFLGSPSPELFLRWMTFSAYTPLFRNHAMNTSLRREPWEFGEPYLTMIRNIINERYRLIPYIYSLFYHDATQALPVVSPLPFYFPGDEKTYSINDEFMLGSSLLVAPILTEGEPQSRQVYLPLGSNWINQSNDELLLGGSWTLIGASIDKIPVFVREGSIITRAPVSQSTSSQSLSKRELDIYCGNATQFELYDDDGLSLDFTNGVFLVTKITCDPSIAQIKIERLAGTWKSPSNREWRLNVHRIPGKPATLFKSGVPLSFFENESELERESEGWTYTIDKKIVVRLLDLDAPILISAKF